MSRVVCLAEVCAGAQSPLMTSQELRDIVCSSTLSPVTYVSGSLELPAAAAAARLAPHVAARSLELSLAGRGRGRGWRVRCGAGAAAGSELRLWFHDELLAVAGLPFLTPNNILGNNYACHECGEQFEEPNPLKLHLFLACEPYSAAAFWDQLLRRVDETHPPSPPPPPPPPPAWLSAFQPAAGLARLALTAPLQAEALAAWWARGGGGAGGGEGGGGRHRCLYCGKVYSRAYGLKIHVRTHTGYKPLRCPHCARPFGDPSNLNKHVRLHVAVAGGGGGAGRGEARRRRRPHRPRAPAATTCDEYVDYSTDLLKKSRAHDMTI